jgi:uncharacterized protein (DUF58 family)
VKRAWFFILLGVICVTLALTTGRDLFYNLSYLIGVTLLLSLFWAWRSVTTVQISRRTRSRRSAVGKTAEESMVIRNTGFLPQAWIEVHDHSTLPWHRISRVINALPSKRYRNWAVRTVCRRRGQFTLGPVTLSSGDPFGLFQFKRELRPTSSIVIYPAVIPIPSFAPPLGQLPGGDAVRGRTHYITTNVSGVRDYAPGDSFSRIHWRSTARTGRLIVKEFELDPTSDIWIFPDMYRRVQHSLPVLEEEPEDPMIAILRGRKRSAIAIDPTTEEYIVTIAASLTQHFIHKDRAVGMVSYGNTREVMQPDRGHRQLTKILETLAMAQATGTIPMTQVLLTEGDRLGRGITLVVITPAMDQTWVAASRELMRRGARVIAVVVDPTKFGGTGDALAIMSELRASKIPAYLVREGDDLAAALSQQISYSPRRTQ